MENISMWDAWVASIVEEDASCPRYECLYVKDGWIYGTNRHVLLMAKTSIKENGTYDRNTFMKINTGFELWDLDPTMPYAKDRTAISLDSFIIRDSRCICLQIL